MQITPSSEGSDPVSSYTTECTVDNSLFRSSAPRLVPLGFFNGDREATTLGPQGGRTFITNPDLKLLGEDMVVRFDTPSSSFVDFRIERANRTASGNLFLVSEVSPTRWLRLLIREDGNFFGTISVNGETYEARIEGNRTVFYSSVDNTLATNPFEDDIAVGVIPGGTSGTPISAAATSDPDVVTVGVLYDDALASVDPDALLAWIDNLIMQANNIYQGSGVNIAFSVVAINQYEPGASLSISDRLNVVSCGAANCNLGSLNGAVDTWRNSARADLVVQLVGTGTGGTCGVGWIPPNGLSAEYLSFFTYSVSAVQNGNGQACPSNVVAHEMGHNFSLGHDRDQGISNTFYPYGVGHKVDANYGTTMSYPGLGFNGYLPFLSNPDISLSGISLGVPIGQANEAHAAQAVANVSAYYEAILSNGNVDLSPPPPSLESYTSTSNSVTLTFQPRRNFGQALPTLFSANCGGSVVSSSSSPITVRGLAADTSYSCFVRSSNQYGTSDASDSLSVVTEPGETFNITPSSGSGGSISPSTVQVVSRGEVRSFSVTADATYGIQSVTGCGGSLTGSIYTTGAISSSCTVSATFQKDTFIVTPYAGQGGTISPDQPQTMESGQSVSFTVTPNSGNRISTVTGCGGTLSGQTYVTGPITESCQVSASFEQYWTVTSAETTATFTNLPSSTRFECKTYSTNAAGDSDFSDALYFVTQPAERPSAVVIDRYDYEEGEITLYVSAGSDGGQDITQYYASCSDATQWTVVHGHKYCRENYGLGLRQRNRLHLHGIC